MTDEQLKQIATQALARIPDDDLSDSVLALVSEIRRLRPQRDRLLELAKRVAEPGADEHRIGGTLTVVLEARALVRLIGGGR